MNKREARMSQIEKKELILETSLQSFFFDELQKVNHKSQHPLRNELIFYSSNVMDCLSESDKYFQIIDGKIQEKLLGPKLLQAENLSKAKKKKELKDVGDTALLLCGLFPESLEGKIVDARYYQDLGKMAYSQLDGLVPSFLDMESFYRFLARSFEMMTNLMSIVATKF
ncbi:MAG: hypothetical protein WCG27_06325, partial [Pseudomonadota bacterium]